MVKKSGRAVAQSPTLLESQSHLPLAAEPQQTYPSFRELLAKPMVKSPLPSGFTVEEEATHLEHLWDSCLSLHRYSLEGFVHAGGSGMVFKVSLRGAPAQALKVVRKRIYSREETGPNTPTALSPVSQRELLALERISHPNVVRLYDAMENDRGVIAISTTYIDNPMPLDEYLSSTLRKDPDPQRKKGVHPFSPQRLDDACAFLVKRCQEMAAALAHMHALSIFHFDIKPANILISSANQAVLTDLGACVHASDLDTTKELRVQFTWTYAHNDLTTLIADPASISGGGLKATAKVNPAKDLAKYDLFAFGRTLQEALAILEREFGERCYASYGFRYLHLIASLLLDGHNAPKESDIRESHGRRFVSDQAMSYPVELFKSHKISTAADLVDRLSRFSREYSWYARTPELDPWQPEVVNTGIGEPAPFTKRVAGILGHPCLRRLTSELQLGWIKEIYPGATHSRWSHTIGVFSSAVGYYNSLLSDPEVPTLRIMIDPADIDHGVLAAILHDVGQTAFAHDFEAACPELYDHEKVVGRLLDETRWGRPTLKEAIRKWWPEVSLDRVMNILQHRKALLTKPVDGVAGDIIDGPIDADKFDYIPRDSVACGVPYGSGIDRSRFLQALSVDARKVGASCRLALAYRAKGSAAIESLLLARYQMYGAVYWHHTFRCIQAMFTHVAAATFSGLGPGGKKSLRGTTVSTATVSDLIYYRVVCGASLVECENIMRSKAVPRDFFKEAPAVFAGERALEFLWKFAEDKNRALLERIARRDLYKRVFEARLGDFEGWVDYHALKAEFMPKFRPSIAAELERRFLDSIYKTMTQRGPIESISEDEARRRYQELKKPDVPLVVVDLPVRGIPEEKNVPSVIGDPARKYISGYVRSGHGKKNVLYTVRDLQSQIAAIRVFAAPELHELIVRYLNPQDVQTCVESVVDRIRVSE